MFACTFYGFEAHLSYSTKLIKYPFQACKECHCVDLTTNQNHGQLTGQKCVTWDIKVGHMIIDSQSECWKELATCCMSNLMNPYNFT